MGSFNVACSVSNLSIHCGDPLYYIPLVKAKYPNTSLYDGNNFLIYSRCIYAPATLPLLGEYGDYGYVEYIDRNTPHIKLLEAFFELDDIHHLINEDDKRNLKGICSGMYVLKEAYDAISDKVVDDCNNLIAKEMMSSLLKHAKEIEEHQTILEEYKKKEEEAKTKEDKESWGKMIALQLMSPMFRWEPFREYPLINEIYGDHLFEDGIKEEIFKFLMFESGMYGCNCFYFPAMNGYQCGNDYMSLKLAKQMVKVLNKRIEERQ